MNREFTCVVCPNGCQISAEYTVESGVVSVNKISGNTCPRGEEYVKQEIIDPRRTVATSVLVLNGELPLVSVRTTKAIPKNRIFDVMNEIHKYHISAPAVAGTVLIKNILGLDSDVVITKNVGRLS